MKKINLQESQLKKLFEDHRELKIPFERGLEKGYDYKNNYEHFIDWLEHIGRYGTLNDSGFNNESLYELMCSKLEDAYEKYINSWDNGEQACYSSFDNIFNKAYRNNTLDKYFNISHEIIEKAIECGSLSEVSDSSNVIDYYNYLTKRGIEEFKKQCINYIKSAVIDDGLSTIDLNESGLIYVEREITIPDVLNTKFDSNYEPHQYNFFDYLDSKMKGVGICWSWEEGMGNAYYANTFNVIPYSVILMKGHVDPRSVDWVETLSINTYMENSEAELRLLKNNVVEIDEVLFNEKNILRKPILVKT